MRLEVVGTLNEWLALQDEWNELLDRSSVRVPFLRHEFLLAWWKHLGGHGEWPQGELHVVVARDEGRLVAAAPFFLAHSGGSRLAALIGGDYVADYLDVLAEPPRLNEFIAALLAHFCGPAAPAWDALHLPNLQADSPTVAAVAGAAKGRGLSCRLTALDDCQVLRLAESWPSYLERRVTKRHRHEILRKIRRLEAQREVRWYFADDPATIAADIEDYLRLLDQHADCRKHLTCESRAQLEEIIAAAAQGGWLRLAFLEIEGRRAAAFIAFDFAGTIWGYDTCYAGEYAWLSPGAVLLSYLLAWAIEEGREAFDLLRGDHSYKLFFGSVRRKMVAATIERAERPARDDAALLAKLGCAAIVSRLEPAVRSTAKCEIVTIALEGGRRSELFCKHGAARSCAGPPSDSAVEGSESHRQGVGYEARVYEEVLRRWAGDVPRLHAAFFDESTNEHCLALEYLDGAVPLEFVSRPKAAIVTAARWLGPFHAAGAAEESPAFLRRYDGEFYAARLGRALKFVAAQERRQPWLPALYERCLRRLAAILAPTTIIHGDYRAANILVAGRRIVPIDWESAAVAAGEIDVASLVWGCDEDVAAACERAYELARWPDRAADGFALRLIAAKIHLRFCWLGEADADDTGEDIIDLDELRRLADEFATLDR